MIDPKRAAVRPRILSPETGEPLLLEEEVLALLEAGVTGPVALIGPPGSGKSAAMRHHRDFRLALGFAHRRGKAESGCLMRRTHFQSIHGWPFPT